MDKKIIFLDIDGTLTVPGSNVPPDSALQAIKAARKNGHLIYLCTGRNYDMLSPLLQYEFDGVIASSGAYVVSGQEVIYNCPMTTWESQQIMGTLEQNGIFRTIECLDGAFTDESFKIFLEEHSDEGKNSELLRWRKQIESSLNIRPMAEYKGQDIYKIIVMSPGIERINLVKDKIESTYHFCIQDSEPSGIVNGEILKKDYDKGTGVEKVCKKHNIPLSQSIGFGDSMNDLEMIEKVQLGICMENGSAKLKEIADDICPAVEQDGLYIAFQKYGLL